MFIAMPLTVFNQAQSISAAAAAAWAIRTISPVFGVSFTIIGERSWAFLTAAVTLPAVSGTGPEFPPRLP